MRNIQNILLTEKYRPKALEDLITPKRVGEKLSKGVYQHLLLHGSPGTGKTSAAKVLVKHFKPPSSNAACNQSYCLQPAHTMSL